MLTCVATRDEGSDERRDDEEHHIYPVWRPGPTASDQRSDNVPLRREEPGQDNLQQREREHDECLYPVPTPLFFCRQRVRTHEPDLMREVPHNGQHACNEEHDDEVLQVRQHIAEAGARPPCCHIVVTPDEGVHDRQEVLNHRRRDEHHG